MPVFNVTYEIVTPESAEHGDADERGYIGQGMTLRDALQALGETRTNSVGGVECIEANESPVRSPRWVTVSNSAEFETGAHESRSLHMPDSLTAATRVRIARIAGVRC